MKKYNYDEAKLTVAIVTRQVQKVQAFLEEFAEDHDEDCQCDMMRLANIINMQSNSMEGLILLVSALLSDMAPKE